MIGIRTGSSKSTTDELTTSGWLVAEFLVRGCRRGGDRWHQRFAYGRSGNCFSHDGWRRRDPWGFQRGRFHCSFDFFLDAGGRFFEFADRASQAAGELGQFFAPKEHQSDDHDQPDFHPANRIEKSERKDVRIHGKGSDEWHTSRPKVGRNRARSSRKR